MAQSDLEKQLYSTRYLTFPLGATSADVLPTLNNVPAAGTTYVDLCCPMNGIVTFLGASYTGENGTGPALTVNLVRGSTVLLGTTVSTPATPTYATGSVPVSLGEPLIIQVASANNDNDFTGASVIIGIQAPNSDS